MRPSNSQPKQSLSLADVTGKGSGLPGRYIIHGLEKVGKTSLAAYMPKPVFIETKGETGLESLIEAGQLPEIPHYPEIMDWESLLSAVELLRTGEHDYRTLVIDTLNGGERLCHEHVCNREYKGNWGENGFTAYQRGFDVSLADWRMLLNALDNLRAQRKMTIVALCHTRCKPFKNPLGADYDRFVPDMHDKTWGLSHKRADAILYLNFETFVTESDPTKKGKATSSKVRMLYTEPDAAYVAGNRMGLPPEIEMGSSGQEAWDNFKAALVAAKNVKVGK